MAYSYSCPTCDRKWPYKKPYSICPICRTTAQTSTVGIPMTDEAARFELKNLKFNAFYAKREAGSGRVRHRRKRAGRRRT